jgi:hypothetical protein
MIVTCWQHIQVLTDAGRHCSTELSADVKRGVIPNLAQKPVGKQSQTLVLSLSLNVEFAHRGN